MGCRVQHSTPRRGERIYINPNPQILKPGIGTAPVSPPRTWGVLCGPEGRCGRNSLLHHLPHQEQARSCQRPIRNYRGHILGRQRHVNSRSSLLSISLKVGGPKVVFLPRKPSTFGSLVSDPSTSNPKSLTPNSTPQPPTPTALTSDNVWGAVLREDRGTSLIRNSPPP